MSTTRLGVPAEFGFTASPGDYQPGTWEKSGVTPNGKTPWKMTTRHCRDREDNDTSWAFELGLLHFCASDDKGRDWYSTSTYIKHVKTGATFSSDFEGGRDGSTNTGTTKLKDEIRSLLLEAAAKESMSPQDFAQALPRRFSKFVNDHGLLTL